MGWDYVRGKNLQWVYADSIKDSTWELDAERSVTRKTLAHRLVYQRGHCSGDPSHVIWSVKHDIVKDKSGDVMEEQKYILCTLVQHWQGDWGTKDMMEACFPYYFDCPYEFLGMVPVASQEWRDRVLLQDLGVAV